MKRAERSGKLETIDMVYCGMFAALMAVGAFIKIMLPIGVFEVTFSLQFFFALLAGFLLGGKKGGISVTIYLIIGLIGVPIFAHGGGPGYLLKPTFGFLIGFAAAAFVCGSLKTALRRNTFPRLLLAAFAGEMVYYACGLVYYFIMFNFILPGGSIGLAELFSVWFLSTVVPDFMLCVGASALARQMLRIGVFYDRVSSV